MNFGTTNSAIARHLNISRQAVGKHVRRGMPTSSVEEAASWYFCNVSTSRKKRGTFSILPRRVPSFAFDDDFDSSAALAALVEHAPEDFHPKPVSLDNLKDGFWGESATKSILQILGNGKTAPFKKRENVMAAWLCVSAAQRLHLKLMPEMVAPLLVGLRDQDEIERQLMEWSIAFASRWFGPSFESEPILPESVQSLDEFFRPLEGKE